ncbi:hypothetical protein G6M89_20420 [Natronolimnobius sp. AArcel1]|uniref:hypothetical protein n=1 Tax=Natronolimnobius sp. AArcel1 TaxID=1679093 RepID=UPI0013ED0166|nr:hypothetical protein [Natronolimnobius sp. AArcel1]NGM71335.1 hypothetical protein [Natronolimnobius sp. AArcel1]
MEFLDSGDIRINRDLNALDVLAGDVSAALSEQGIEHVLVSGYMVVLMGRSRGTEDIDTLIGISDISTETIEALADELENRGYWGSAMPLSSMNEMFQHGDPIRVARDGKRIPSVELKPTDLSHVSFQNQRRAIIGLDDGDQIHLPIVAPEVQIAYKLDMGGNVDFEDAYYLFKICKGELNSELLEGMVSKYEVEGEFHELKRQAENGSV